VKYYEVSGRRADEVDASLTFASGLITVAIRKADKPSQVSWPYKSVLAATFVRDRNPRWAASHASPPADLEIRGGFLFLRSARNWLVLQGQAFYVILALPDDRSADILNTLQQRTRVKIDRPAPPK
jgi:hypothetical protein